MRLLLCSCICGLALAFCSAGCSAQCTEGWTTESFQCNGPNGCAQGVTVAYPMSADQYGVAIRPNPQNCCGQLFSSFTAGGNCNPEILKKPGVKRQIAHWRLLPICSWQTARVTTFPTIRPPTVSQQVSTLRLPSMC